MSQDHELRGSDIICNRCRGDLSSDCPPADSSPYGLVLASVVGGYSSRSLTDMCRYTFSICEPCLRKLFAEFRVSPKVEDVDMELNSRGELEYTEDAKFFASKHSPTALREEIGMLDDTIQNWAHDDELWRTNLEARRDVLRAELLELEAPKTIELEFLQSDLAEMRRLLKGCEEEGDELGALGFRSRIEEVDGELRALTERSSA